MNPINNIGLSRELTSAYDFKGFTNEEIWSRIAQKINIMIEHFNYIDNKLNNEKENNTTKFDYLLNEGLTNEINKKMLQYLENGTLMTIINTSIFNDLNKKIDEINARLEQIEKGAFINE